MDCIGLVIAKKVDPLSTKEFAAFLGLSRNRVGDINEDTKLRYHEQRQNQLKQGMEGMTQRRMSQPDYMKRRIEQFEVEQPTKI
uniref:Sigma70_r4 domain-containing protein n=1 Tax=Caenorhabditis tropicalis TaxID=1561998 RepID=A0A1I7TSV6_9PELO